MARKTLSLPETVYSDIQRLMPEFVNTREFIDRCVRCGSALQPEQAECAEQIAFLQKIKEEFFPDRP